MNTIAEYEALSDTNYRSNYDEIFKIDGPESNEQTLPINNELDIYLKSNLLNRIDYRDKID